MIEAPYVTFHVFATEATDWREICPKCNHKNYRHIPIKEIGIKRTVVKCWHCGFVTWVIHILPKSG